MKHYAPKRMLIHKDCQINNVQFISDNISDIYKKDKKTHKKILLYNLHIIDYNLTMLHALRSNSFLNILLTSLKSPIFQRVIIQNVLTLSLKKATFLSAPTS